MGLYPDHGVEYIVFFKNNTKKIIIANTKATDDRLIKSEYYNQRKNEWFMGNYNNKYEPINDNIDIELSESEKELLNKIINENDIEKHGWYESWYIYDTYGP
jgi:hypothetical protein